MEENNACAPTRIFPRIEDNCDARDGLGKEHGRGGAHVSAQSQTARGLERGVASERRAGVSWQGCSAAAETGCRADCRAGTQDRPADDGTRFFKKSLATFQGTTPASRRQWQRRRLYEQIREAAEAEAAVNGRCRRFWKRESERRGSKPGRSRTPGLNRAT